MTALQKRLLAWYAANGRADLPWRVKRDPYYTVISEFMLQQTQVDRVVPKFVTFVRRFPDFRTLAAATTADVLRGWKGLGYNSRAVRLKKLAEEIVAHFGGKMPRQLTTLLALPGIGPYTAQAVRAFGFNEDVAACDVNVRRVVHRLLFGIEFPPLADAKTLDARAQELVPHDEAHDWNSAVMDLGATICTARAPKCLICPLRADCGAAPIDAAALEELRKRCAKSPSPQAALKFEHTTRYARGRIVDRLRELPPSQAISLLELHADLQGTLGERTAQDVRDLVQSLEHDGLVALTKDEFVRLSE